MRAGLRLGTVLAAASLALGAAPALAQSVPQQQNPPASDSVGPRDLQNFNLGGTVTRQAQPPSAPAATAPAPRSAQSEPATTESAIAEGPPAATRTRTPPAQTAAADTPRPAARNEASSPPLQASSSPSANALPAGTTATNPPPAPGFSTAAADASGSVLAPERKLTLWPWLLAALALGAGGAFLFRRSRAREAYAGGAEFDEFTAPEPTPRPLPRPAPKPAPAPPVAAPRPSPEPSIPGLVTTRLRPWLDIGIKPLRFVVEDDKVTIEFELELFNSGSGPARAVLAEASLFNAGGSQEREIGAFFANPVAQGDRIQVIPPLKRVAIKTQVVAPRAHIQAYALAGHEVFVPVIGFNALYSWSGGEGQTSASYLLGRDTKSDKMGPFRLDLGPRIFRGLAARLMPAGVRN